MAAMLAGLRQIITPFPALYPALPLSFQLHRFRWCMAAASRAIAFRMVGNEPLLTLRAQMEIQMPNLQWHAARSRRDQAIAQAGVVGEQLFSGVAGDLPALRLHRTALVEGPIAQNDRNRESLHCPRNLKLV